MVKCLTFQNLHMCINISHNWAYTLQILKGYKVPFVNY